MLSNKYLNYYHCRHITSNVVRNDIKGILEDKELTFSPRKVHTSHCMAELEREQKYFQMLRSVLALQCCEKISTELGDSRRSHCTTLT